MWRSTFTELALGTFLTLVLTGIMMGQNGTSSSGLYGSNLRATVTSSCGGYPGFLDPNTYFSELRVNDYDGTEDHPCLGGPNGLIEDEGPGWLVDGHITWTAISATQAEVTESTGNVATGNPVGTITSVSIPAHGAIQSNTVANSTVIDGNCGNSDGTAIQYILSNPAEPCPPPCGDTLYPTCGGTCEQGQQCAPSFSCNPSNPDDCAGLCICSTSVACNPPDCNDNNPCTDNICNNGTCSHSNYNAASCDDGNPCTTNDVCGGGSCTGTAKNCNDSNSCTVDSCNAETGECTHTNNTASCNDNNACTRTDTCQNGTCVGGNPMPCSTPPNSQCYFQTGTCSNGTCTYFPTSGACNDNNVCTTQDTCANGTCTGTQINCNDDNPCTNDSCNSTTGCAHTNNTGSCDDNNVCTTQDTCANGTCTGTPMNCDDGNVCTTDSCANGTIGDQTIINDNTTSYTNGGCIHEKEDANCCQTDDDCESFDECWHDYCENNQCTGENICDDSSSESSAGEELVSCCTSLGCEDNKPLSECEAEGYPALDPIFEDSGNGLCKYTDLIPLMCGFETESSEASSEPVSSSSSSSSGCTDAEKKSCCYEEDGKHFCENDVCPEDCKKHGVSPYPINGSCPTVPSLSFFQRFTAWLLGASSPQKTEVASCEVPNVSCCRTNCSMKYYDRNGDEKQVPGTYKYCTGDKTKEACDTPVSFTKPRTTYIVSCGGGSLKKSLQCSKDCNTTNEVLCCLPNEDPPKTTNVFGGQCSLLGGYEVQLASECKPVLIDCCTDPMKGTTEKKTENKCLSPNFVVTQTHKCKPEADCAKISDGQGGTYMGCTWADTYSAYGECEAKTWQLNQVTGGYCCCPPEEKKNCCRMVSTPTGNISNPFTISWQCTYEGNASDTSTTACTSLETVGDTIYHPGTVLPGTAAQCKEKCTGEKMESGCCCNLKSGSLAGTTSLWLSYNSGFDSTEKSPASLCSSYAGSFTKASGMGGKSCDSNFCNPSGWCCTAEGAKKTTQQECNPNAYSQNEFEAKETMSTGFCERPCCAQSLPQSCAKMTQKTCSDIKGTFKSTAKECPQAGCEKKVPCCYRNEEGQRWQCNDAYPSDCKKRLDNKQLVTACPKTGSALNAFDAACGGSEDNVHCCSRDSVSAAWTCDLKPVSQCNDPTNNISLGKATSKTCSADEMKKCTTTEDTVSCCSLTTDESGNWPCIEVKKSEEATKCQKGTTFGQLKCSSIQPAPQCPKPPERLVACCSTVGTCFQKYLQEGKTCDNAGGAIEFFSKVYDPPSECNSSNCQADKPVPCCKNVGTNAWQCEQVANTACINKCPTTASPTEQEINEQCGKNEKVPCCTKNSTAWSCATALSKDCPKEKRASTSSCPSIQSEIDVACGELPSKWCCFVWAQEKDKGTQCVEMTANEQKEMGASWTCPWADTSLPDDTPNKDEVRRALQTKFQSRTACEQSACPRGNRFSFCCDPNSGQCKEFTFKEGQPIDCSTKPGFIDLGKSGTSLELCNEACAKEKPTVCCPDTAPSDSGGGSFDSECLPSVPPSVCREEKKGTSLPNVTSCSPNPCETVACCPGAGGECATNKVKGECKQEAEMINTNNTCSEELKKKCSEIACCKIEDGFRTGACGIGICSGKEKTDNQSQPAPLVDGKAPTSCGPNTCPKEEKIACCKDNKCMQGEDNCKGAEKTGKKCSTDVLLTMENDEAFSCEEPKNTCCDPTNQDKDTRCTPLLNINGDEKCPDGQPLMSDNACKNQGCSDVPCCVDDGSGGLKCEVTNDPGKCKAKLDGDNKQCTDALNAKCKEPKKSCCSLTNDQSTAQCVPVDASTTMCSWSGVTPFESQSACKESDCEKKEYRYCCNETKAECQSLEVSKENKSKDCSIIQSGYVGRPYENESACMNVNGSPCAPIACCVNNQCVTGKKACYGEKKTGTSCSNTILTLAGTQNETYDCGIEEVPCCITNKDGVETGGCGMVPKSECTKQVTTCEPNPCQKKIVACCTARQEIETSKWGTAECADIANTAESKQLCNINAIGLMKWVVEKRTCSTDLCKTIPRRKVSCTSVPGDISLANCVGCRQISEEFAQSPVSPLLASTLLAQTPDTSIPVDPLDAIGMEFPDMPTCLGSCPAGTYKRYCCNPATASCSAFLLSVADTNTPEICETKEMIGNGEYAWDDGDSCSDFCASFKGVAGGSGDTSSSDEGDSSSSSEAPQTGNCCIAGKIYGLCFADFDKQTCEFPLIDGTFFGEEQCIESPADGYNCGPTDEDNDSSEDSSSESSEPPTPCGNGTVEEGEECDEGDLNSNSPNATCRPDCTTARCGDSIKDDSPLDGREKELCDDGDQNSDTGTATCKVNCRNRNTFFTIGNWLQNLQLFAINGTPLPDSPVISENTQFITIGVLTFILH